MTKALAPNKKEYLGKYELEDMEYLKFGSGSKPTLLSMFTGCGGCALGFNAAGYEVRVMVEIDKHACSTLRTNWTREGHIASCNKMIALLEEKKEPPGRYIKKKKGDKFRWQGPDEPGARAKMIAHEKRQRARKKWAKWAQEREPVILERDIKEITSEEILKAADLRIGEADVLEGGYPCQGFSTANSKRKELGMKDARNWLYLELVRVIRETLPKAIMLENVPGLVSMEKGQIIRMICNDMANCGYSISWDILNAADYGVPQNRRRVIMIGTRNDVLVMPARKKCLPQLHIGGASGPITHPDWFLKKYPDHTQGSLFDKIKK